MKTLEHQITITEAINSLEAQQMSDQELILYEKAIKEVKKKRGIGGRYGGEEHYKSGRDDYMTPPDIYGSLLELFNRNKFDIDVCCTKENIPANIHYTKNENGLLQKWSGLCFCNPPWDKTPKWVAKGFEESTNPGTHICFVIPSNRFETGYMQDYIINNPNALWLILPQKRGFIIPGQEDKKPIPSVGVAIAIMSPEAKKLQKEINNKNLFKATAFIGNS
ncbi:MAG: hypothetical protein E7Z93_00575 [Cyanobacteria bacterium SIG32]|nr:hypothetical protein [Cyanobacteria bacterium SIG32]